MNMKGIMIALVVLVLLCLLGPVVVGILSALVAIPVRRAVDPGRHRLLPQVTLTGKE